MRHAFFLPLLMMLVPTPTIAIGPSAPRRIVSLNLCADQYLLALADRDQIAALTRFARDPDMSAMAVKAQGVPFTRGSAETVVELRPDLVVGASALHRQTMAILGPVAKLAIKPANSYADIVDQVRAVAAAVGHRERGEALIAAMDKGLTAIPPNAGHGATAAYYQRRGFLTGTGTLIDDLLHRVGLRNLAARLGKPAIASIGVEQMALARPDYLIVEEDSDRVVDQGTEMLQHPLLANIPRLKLPQAWTVCGGPAYVQAAARLASQLRSQSR